jgi:hypothetical protein
MRPLGKTFVPFLFVTVSVLTAGTMFAQDQVAEAIVRSALEKLGGEAKIRSLRSIYYSAKGFEDSEVNAQPFKPGSSAKNSHEEKLAVFLDGRRLAYELKTDRGDGTTRHRRFYFPDDRRVVADFINRSVFASNIQYPSADRDQDARRVPHALLLEAQGSPTLKFEGVRRFGGLPHDVVSFVPAIAVAPVFLYIDKQTRLLVKYEFTADFPGI